MWETWVLEPPHAAEQSFFLYYVQNDIQFEFQTFSVHYTISFYIYVSCLVIFFLWIKVEIQIVNEQAHHMQHARVLLVVVHLTWTHDLFETFSPISVPNIEQKNIAKFYFIINNIFSQIDSNTVFLHYNSGSLNSNLPFSVWNVYCMTCFISLSFIYLIYKKN